MADATDPLRLFARQALRTALVPEWFSALGLGDGDSVVDLGCGAGYVALRAAQHVGPAGKVHAVDADPEAVAFLGELAGLHRLDQIHCQVSTLDALQPFDTPPKAGFMSMVLHHVEHQAETLRHLAETLDGAPILIAEFNAEGPCQVGPPREMRLAREQVEAVARGAGMQPRAYREQTEEHWFMVVAP